MSDPKISAQCLTQCPVIHLSNEWTCSNENLEMTQKSQQNQKLRTHFILIRAFAFFFFEKRAFALLTEEYMTLELADNEAKTYSSAVPSSANTHRTVIRTEPKTQLLQNHNHRKRKVHNSIR